MESPGNPQTYKNIAINIVFSYSNSRLQSLNPSFHLYTIVNLKEENNIYGWVSIYATEKIENIHLECLNILILQDN